MYRQGNKIMSSAQLNFLYVFGNCIQYKRRNIITHNYSIIEILIFVSQWQ